MKVRVPAVAAVTLVVAGLVLLEPGRSGAADAPARTRLELVTADAQSIRLNVGAKATSAGDRLVFSHLLTREGEPAGLSGVECVVTSAMPGPKPKTTKAKKQKRARIATSHCLATLDLPDGQIAAQGLSTLAEPGGAFNLAVTGGTGAHAGAVGTLRSRPGSGGKGRLVLVIAPRG